MNEQNKKLEWLNNLPVKYKLSSNDKIEALTNSAKNKIYFGQRGIGKTHMLMLDLAYYLKHNSNKRVGMISRGAYVSRLNFDTFTDMLNCIMEDEIDRITKFPLTIRMKNESIVYFFSSGDEMRGHKLNAEFIDDLDFIADEHFYTALASTVIYEDSFIIANQTPIMNTDKVMAIIGGNKN